MIVDVHAHAWDCQAHIQPDFLQDLHNAHPGTDGYENRPDPTERSVFGAMDDGPLGSEENADFKHDQTTRKWAVLW